MENEIRKDIAFAAVPIFVHLTAWILLTLLIPTDYTKIRTFLVIYKYLLLFIVMNMLGIWMFPPPSLVITSASPILHKKNALISLAFQAFCIYLFTRYLHSVSTNYWVKSSMFYTTWFFYVLIVIILLTRLLIGKSFPQLFTTTKS